MVDEINAGSSQISAFNRRQASDVVGRPEQRSAERVAREEETREAAVRVDVTQEVLDTISANADAANEAAPTTAELREAATGGRIPSPGATIDIFI